MPDAPASAMLIDAGTDGGPLVDAPIILIDAPVSTCVPACPVTAPCCIGGTCQLLGC